MLYISVVLYSVPIVVVVVEFEVEPPALLPWAPPAPPAPPICVTVVVEVLEVSPLGYAVSVTMVWFLNSDPPDW